MHPSILAIMVNWNGKTFLKNSVSTTLDELSKCGGELLIVDNASSDGSVEFLETSFPNVRILQTGDNLGGAGGFNAGMRAALSSDYQYVWLLDNDILVEENALPPLLEVLQQNKEIGAAGSQICLYDRPETVQEIGGMVTPYLAALRQHASGGKRLPADTPPVESDYLAACSLLIKRECLEQVGVFGDFFIFYDDVEWGLRARMHGWKLCAVPASVILHNYNAIKPTVAWRDYYRKRNRIAVIHAYPSRYIRQLSALIYLTFVNYALFSYRWCGNQVLSRALRNARDDAINGHLGKRDLNFLAENLPPTVSDFQMLSDQPNILIDITDSAGDALSAIQQLSTRHPYAHFFLPHHLVGYLNYLEWPDLQLVSNRQCFDMTVIGHTFRLSSLRISKTVCRFAGGSFILINRPWLYASLDAVKRLVAAGVALSISPLHWLILLRRGKRTF